MSLLAIEEQMLALLPKKDEGSVTDADSGVTVSYKLTRTVDAKSCKGMARHPPERAQARAFRWKADVDPKALRGLQEFDGRYVCRRRAVHHHKLWPSPPSTCGERT